MKIQKQQVMGIVLAFVLAAVAQFFARWVPQIGAETLAMLLGILLGNTVFGHERYGAGVKWAEKYPIEIGIALLGATLTLKTISQLGWQGVGFIVVNMALTIGFVYVLGTFVFKVGVTSTLLMGAGNAVCGSSAIAAVAPVLGAHDDQRRTAVATVSLTGMFLLLTLPSLSQVLFGTNDFFTGALIGGTVQSVGQVVGTAALVNNQVVTYATLFKLLRVLLLVVVVLVFAKIAPKKGVQDVDTSKRPTILPWFIAIFIGLTLLNSIVGLPNPVRQMAHHISSFFGIVNLAAIGLNLRWATIKNSGVKFLSYGLIVGVVQVILALGLIHLFW